MSEIKLSANTYVYDFWSEGDRFTIHVSLDDEWGWQANVSVCSFAQGTPQDALNALQKSVTRLADELKNATFETSPYRAKESK